MDSSFIRKIEKAKGYALQPERIRIKNYAAEFQGDNGNYTITYEKDQWHCNCDYHVGRDTCTHIMAMQIMHQSAASA